MAFGFPPSVLRLTLESFAFARRLTYQQAVTHPTHTLSAVLAGGGFAQTAMLLILLAPLDHLWDGFQNRGISLCVYVDDIALHAVGSEAIVACSLADASATLVQRLEGDLSMVVSRRAPWSRSGTAKTIATVSSRRLAGRVNTTMRRLGIIVLHKAKHLGVTFAPGGRTRDANGKQPRWATIAERHNRAVKLGRKLGIHVFSHGTSNQPHFMAPLKRCRSWE